MKDSKLMLNLTFLITGICRRCLAKHKSIRTKADQKKELLGMCLVGAATAISLAVIN